MARFIETSDGAQVLSTEVVSVRKCGRGRSLITTRLDEHHVVKQITLYDIKRIIEDDTAQIIPATPGYMVAFVFSPARRNGEWRTVVYPVVGWRVIESGCDLGHIYDSAPVVAGSHDISTDWAIILPDGKLYSSRSDWPMTMEEWIQAEKEAYEKDDYYPGEEENRGDEDGNKNDENQEAQSD